MNNKIKNIIYLLIITFSISLISYSIIDSHSACKKQGYSEIETNLSEVVCRRILPDGATTQTSRGNGLGLLLLVIIFVTIIFYRQVWDRLTYRLYSYFSEQNIKREGLFIGIAIFLYCFIPISGKYLFAFIFHLYSVDATMLLQGILIAFLVAFPLGISIYFGKKILNSENPKKIFPIMLIRSSIFTVALAVMLETIITFNGLFNSMASLLLLEYSLIYISFIFILTLILAFHLYYYKFSQNRLMLKWLGIILLIIPYMLIAIENFF
jgi:hypothetical protein